MRIYKTLIQPILEYTSEVWDGCPNFLKLKYI